MHQKGLFEVGGAAAKAGGALPCPPPLLLRPHLGLRRAARRILLGLLLALKVRDDPGQLFRLRRAAGLVDLCAIAVADLGTWTQAPCAPRRCMRTRAGGARVVIWPTAGRKEGRPGAARAESRRVWRLGFVVLSYFGAIAVRHIGPHRRAIETAGQRRLDLFRLILVAG